MRILPIMLLAVVGCAPTVAQRPAPTPAEITGLERAAQQNPLDVATRIQLGTAYRDAGRAQDARVVLESVTDDAPDNAAAHLMLGLTREDLEDWPGARVAYERYIALGSATNVKQTMERRLQYVQRKELEQSVLQLARDERAGRDPSGPPEPGTVAVFPFLYQGQDSNLRPLGRALAEMLVTDLSQTERLRVLERAQVQLLLDELELGQSVFVDPATAARSGRRLRAGRVVQGSIGGDAAGLDLGAFVVRLDQDAPRTPINEHDALDRLFEMEKRLAVGLYEQMGVQLTVAERERVMRRPTENIQALLAFGLGLEAEDRGEFDLAASQYARAVSLDPGFGMAEVRGTEAGAIVEAEQMTVAVVIDRAAESGAVPVTPSATSGSTSGTSNAGSAAASAGVSFAPTTGLAGGPIGTLPDPFLRDAGSEVLGREGVATRTVLRILFIRPTN